MVINKVAHLISKSFSGELQTVKLNTGFAHPDCHEIFDDHHDKAIYLSRIVEVLCIIWTLDDHYFKMNAENFGELYDACNYIRRLVRKILIIMGITDLTAFFKQIGC